MSYPGSFPFPISAGGTNHITSPSFFSFVNSTVNNVTGDGTNYTVIFNATTFDVTLSYNTVTGTFTVPVTGNYFFGALVYLTGVAVGNTQAQLTLNTGSSLLYILSSSVPFTISNSGQVTVGGSCYVALTADDTVTIKIQVNGIQKGVNVAGAASPNFFSYFGGHLLI